MKKPSLSYYSYDSRGNPWLSGGGSLRDWEVLPGLAKHMNVTLVVGGYSGFRPVAQWHSHRGCGPWESDGLCGLTYSLTANLRLLLDDSEIIGISPSIYAPILTWWFRRRAVISSLHHYIGKRSISKIRPFWNSSVSLRNDHAGLGRTYFVSNRAIRDRIQRMNPKARAELTTNGFDPALLQLDPKPRRHLSSFSWGVSMYT